MATDQQNTEELEQLNEKEQIQGMLSQIGAKQHTDAASVFSNIMSSKISDLLNDRTKELAQQIFGPSFTVDEEFEEVEADEALIESLNTHLANLLEAVADEVEDFDVDLFVESFIESIDAQGILPEAKSFWQPDLNKFTKKGVARKHPKKVQRNMGDPRRQKAGH